MISIGPRMGARVLNFLTYILLIYITFIIFIINFINNSSNNSSNNLRIYLEINFKIILIKKNLFRQDHDKHRSSHVRARTKFFTYIFY